MKFVILDLSEVTKNRENAGNEKNTWWRRKYICWKKVLRKLVTLTVTVATVATMAAPVSGATLTPKKSHSKAEITEYVDYLNDITDSWTFRADGYVPAFSVSDEDD